MSKAYDELQTYMDKAMAIKTAMTLFEWDNETLAPREAGELTSKVIGVLSGEYFQAVTCDEMKKLLEKCRGDKSLTTAEAANVRELLEEREQICPIPQDEYQDSPVSQPGLPAFGPGPKRTRILKRLPQPLKRSSDSRKSLRVTGQRMERSCTM